MMGISMLRRHSATIVVALLAIIAPRTSVAGPRFDISDDSWMKISVLGQPHFSYSDSASDNLDFYLRRGRLILAGQIFDGAKFFLETDNANAGRDGCDEGAIELQDIFVDLRLGKSQHWLQVGLILIPFSFEVKSSAASLLGIDYNAEAIKLDHCFVWRDYGAELHGSVGKKFGYRVGLFDGYDNGSGSMNDDAGLRCTGHLAYNVVGDVQTGWFYSQERLATDAYVAVGVGLDYQKDSTITTVVADPLTSTTMPSTVSDSTSWVIDLQSGWTMGPVGVTLNGALYNWDNARFDGTTAFIETGLRMDKVMITGKCSLQDSDENDASSTTDYTVGLHYFLNSHNVRGGVEYRSGDSDDLVLCGMQFLL